MASRPLPPGRRGRGSRSTSALHLPEHKILSVSSNVTNDVAPTSSYVGQLRTELEQPSHATVEPEHESTASEKTFEPTVMQSVKVFASSLENTPGSLLSTLSPAAPAAGEDPSLVQPTEVVMGPTPIPVQAESAKDPVSVPVEAVALPDLNVEEQASAFGVATPPVALPPAVDAPQTAKPSAVITPTHSTATHVTPTRFEAPVLEGFHPFKLLLPIHAVPEIPETVDCVFDCEAVEMQKNIMKTIKKIFGKDRMKLEDFKINSRLFGNNFMDPLEYIESLVKDLGGNRALLLVPCLVSIQPDFVKRSSMLVASRNYRLRSLAKLEATLDKGVLEPSAEVVAPAIPTTSGESAADVPQELSAHEPSLELSPATTRVAVSLLAKDAIHNVTSLRPDVEHAAEGLKHAMLEESSRSDVVETDADSLSMDVVNSDATTPTTVFSPEKKELPSTSVTAVETSRDTQAGLQVFTPPIDATVAAIVEPGLVKAMVVDPVASAEIAAPVPKEPAVAITSHFVDAEPPVATQIRDVSASAEAPVHIDVASVDWPPAADDTPLTELNMAKIENSAQATTVNSASSFRTADTSASSERSSLSSVGGTEPAVAAYSTLHPPVRRKSTINLFGEEIGDDDDDDESDDDAKNKPENSSGATSSSASTEPSAFLDAESLFGEFVPVPVKLSSEPEPVPPPPVKIPRPGMLFGFGSAGADSDSDSDSDSEFSD